MLFQGAYVSEGNTSQIQQKSESTEKGGGNGVEGRREGERKRERTGEILVCPRIPTSRRRVGWSGKCVLLANFHPTYYVDTCETMVGIRGGWRGGGVDETRRLVFVILHNILLYKDITPKTGKRKTRREKLCACACVFTLSPPLRFGLEIW